jgi:hypothetical protein
MTNLPFGLGQPPPENFSSTFESGPPSFIKQAKTFTTAVVRHVAGGMPQTSDDERDRRMEICRGCPAFTGGEDPKCNECGCYLKIKTSWALESCPQNKWGSITKTGGCGCNKT